MNESNVMQLHRTLVDAIRRTRPGGVDKPVTVAEIYQDLVPYRTARAVGFEMNADYEYALLRLLAGEGDLARIEPREVRDKLRMELESANPDVGLYRHYAACDVWVNAGDADVVPEAELTLDMDQMVSWEDEFLSSDSSPAPQTAAPQPRIAEQAVAEDLPEAENVVVPPPPTRPKFEIAAAAPEPAAGPEPDEIADDEACVFCGGDLPSGRVVNYCPFCGADQSQRPCPSCGELLDPLWRFCVSCGTRVRPLEDHVN